MSNMINIAPCDKETSLRKQIFDYAVSQADGPYKKFIPRLSQAWQKFNELYFDGSLTPAYIAITSPVSPKAIADCSIWSSYGGKHQIRIRENVINGEYKGFNSNHSIENRWLYILDVLLHEQVHQWQHEILDIYDDGYEGHGEEFTNKVNLIGLSLGLPLVDKRRRKNKSIAISSQWPKNVRPAGYYGDLFKVVEPKEPEPDDEPNEEPEQDWLTKAIEAFRMLTPEQHPAFIEATGIVIINHDSIKPSSSKGDIDLSPEPVETKPVESKPVVKVRKSKKSKSPPGCLSKAEIIKAINLGTELTVLSREFDSWLDNGLFPNPDMRDNNTGDCYWSEFIIVNWFKNIPDGCKTSATMSIQKIDVEL